MDPKKSDSIRNWPVPKTKHDMQAFIGTCVYVMRFCADFAEHVAVLTEVIRDKRPRDPVSLNPQQLAAFNILKTKLTSPPVLAHPDFSKPFHVNVDASDFAIGGYLFQLDENKAEKVIAYGGRKLSKPEMVYPTREKELLAALHAMRTWKVYLLDRPFYLNTDHHTLETILQQQTCSQRLARWLNELALFQPLFKWVPGPSNVIADAISRRQDWNDGTFRSISLSELLHALSDSKPPDADEQLLQMTTQTIDIKEACRSGYDKDAYFGPIMRELSEDSPRPTRRLRRLSLEDGLLFFRVRPDSPARLCIPDVNGLRKTIMFEEHDVPTRGHPGQGKTLLLLLEQYYWKGMAQSVEKYVDSCELCQRNKSVRGRAAGLLHPLEIPGNRWENISMDFLSPLPTTQAGFDAVFVIVDRLTKRAHFLPTHSTATAATTAQLFCDFYQRLHGLPLSIVSDRDTKFTAALWRSIMELQGTRLHLCTAFKPSTDGQSEVTIKFVGECLRHFVGPHHDNWDELLFLAEFAYNSRTHSSIGMSPFVADLGYQPRTVADCSVNSSRTTRASTFVTHQQAIIAEAQDAMAAAQFQWHAAYDRNRLHMVFKVGEEVLLDTKHLDLAHMGTDGKRKLAARFIGPCRISKVAGPDTYTLELPPGLRLHPDYHVSRLRPYIRDEDPHRVTRVQPVLVADGSEGHLVTAILGHRRRRGVQQFQVQWLDSTLKPSWEPLVNLLQVLALVRRNVDSLPQTRATARLREEVSRVQPA
ncbi:hypothetical protein PF004_g24723 [Phytophthora fragariae]|uniref:Integrase catalytic domain-containing protein n=1 Tax=Phytophthora fragariae TaxID=53985 RepID=A0A6A3HUB3_9STRA|nr:hypothetical protein PF011_g25584 [Phytophthora fragariae]KAE9180847.1 hypothetical protein PF004_g24723 [Phytophthora fragariae]